MTEEEKKAQEAKAAADKAAAEKAAADKAAADKAAEDAKKGADGQVNDSAFKAAIEKARTQEKQKLYPRIEKLESEIKERDAAMKETQAKLDKLAQENEALTAGKMTGADVLKKQLEEQSRSIEVLKKDLELSKQEADNKLKQSELKAFREKALREAGSAIIQELVTGGTEEEILASVELAKKRYQEVYQSALEQKKNPAPAAPGKTNPPAKPPEQQNKTFTPEEISKMTLEQYKQNRQAILGSLKNQTTGQ